MLEINNYIPINRKIFEHQFWCEDRVYSRFEAWLDILQSTRFEDTEFLVGNRLIAVKRGQLPVSLRYLSERWKWSTKKVNNFLNLLILAQMATKETLKETGQTLLTVCNYDKYNFYFEEKKQRKKQEGNTKETLRKQQGNNLNNDNKDNNLNNNPPTPLKCDECDEISFEKVWELYERKGNKKTSMKKWANLKNLCREAALKHIPLYVKATPDKQYRKNFETYLNQECWNDEIINKNETGEQKTIAYIDL